MWSHPQGSLQSYSINILSKLPPPLFQVSLRQEPCLFSSVPPQPVPPLAHTLQGYLRALEPLLPPEEIRHTRRMVQEFGRPGGLGARLQDGLERRARHTKNWVCVTFISVGSVTDVRAGVVCMEDSRVNILVTLVVHNKWGPKMKHYLFRPLVNQQTRSLDDYKSLNMCFKIVLII